MKAAAVSMVKNEGDIIELFVKINLRAFERLYIVDHDSSDGTPAILQKLMGAGHPITVVPFKGIQQSQAQIITRLVRDVAATGEYDFIVPLDADEFITPPRGWLELLHDSLGSDRYGKLPWRTFVPVSGDYFGADAPLHANFRMRSQEPAQYHKVVIPNRLAKACIIGPGNHALVGADGVELPFELLHAPVRSSDQLVQKAVIGSHTLSIKRDRLPNEGFHWDMLAREVRANGYRLGDDDLLRFALAYAAGEGDPAAQVSDDDRRIGSATDAIEHKDLARIRPVAALDAFLGKTCAEINALQDRLDAKKRRFPWSLLPSSKASQRLA
ncbi:MAG TPA: glycosyltransferase family 2 protein [Luteimonas sp.]|nr:glycosyltransferase family 2 protein [Luteimonas sp.]